MGKLEQALSALAQWRGEVEQTLRENARRIGKLSDKLDSVTKDISDLRVEMQSVKSSVKIWSTIGAIAGSAIVSFLVGRIG